MDGGPWRLDADQRPACFTLAAPIHRQWFSLITAKSESYVTNNYRFGLWGIGRKSKRRDRARRDGPVLATHRQSFAVQSIGFRSAGAGRTGPWRLEFRNKRGKQRPNDSPHRDP